MGLLSPSSSLPSKDLVLEREALYVLVFFPSMEVSFFPVVLSP